MIKKKLLWVIKRHPFLYLTRFRLLSKNTSVESIERLSYNEFNPKEEIPSYFEDINALVFQLGRPKNKFELVTQLSVWLFEHIKGGPGLSEPSDVALRIMLEGKGGVCSDMAQAFNNFCVINDVFVREWGTTRAPFDKGFGGHSFNEIYSNEHSKWVLIDVYNCIVFYDELGDIPLSVVELYDCLRNGQEIIHKSFNSERLTDVEVIQRNFLHSNTIPFLISNYSNKIYDQYLKRYRPYFPIFIIHFWLFLMKKSYCYLFPLDNYRRIFS